MIAAFGGPVPVLLPLSAKYALFQAYAEYFLFLIQNSSQTERYEEIGGCLLVARVTKTCYFRCSTRSLPKQQKSSARFSFSDKGKLIPERWPFCELFHTGRAY